MSDLKARRAAEIQAAIRHILYQEWDPIGVAGHAPKDEYDAYIGGIYHILADTPTEEALVAYLFRTETEQMGIAAPSLESLRRIAQQLLEIDIRL